MAGYGDEGGRHASPLSGTHAAAVVITAKPVTEYSPLALNKKDESITTQYHMNNINDLGL